MQVGKLKLYQLLLRHRRLHYAPGTLHMTLGPLLLHSGGFMLTGIPLVMGEHPSPQIVKAEASLANIERALYQPRPAYVLVLRIVLVYVISALDYVYEAMPPCPTRLHRTQRAEGRVLTKAPRVPRNVPRALLWMLVAGGGFGFPHLYSRMCLRHIVWYLKAMDSRSVLVTTTWAPLATRTTRRASTTRTRSACSTPWLRPTWRCTFFRLPRHSPPPWTPGCIGRTSSEGCSWPPMERWRPRRTATPWGGARLWRTPGRS